VCLGGIDSVADVVDGADERVAVFVREVGAKQQTIGAERVDGAPQGRRNGSG